MDMSKLENPANLKVAIHHACIRRDYTRASFYCGIYLTKGYRIPQHVLGVILSAQDQLLSHDIILGDVEQWVKG